MLAAIAPDAAGRTYELGGPEVRSFADLVALALAYTGRKRCVWNMPVPLARLQAAFLEHLPGKPLTNDQITLLARDNVVCAWPAGAGGTGAGADPDRAGILPAYLTRYRAGGKDANARFQE